MLANGDTRAFFWEQSTGMTELPAYAAGASSRALGVNNLGWIVGSSAGKAIVWINGIPRDITGRIINISSGHRSCSLPERTTIARSWDWA